MRIPISPRADYFNRVFFIARSIKAFYHRATFRVSIGPECPVFDPAERYPWSNALDITWNWVGHDDFLKWKNTAHPYIATMMDRFKPPFQTDYILMIDADVIAIRRFDELFEQPAGLSGVIAHGSPFQANHRETWTELFGKYGLGEPQFNYEHSGWRSMFSEERLRMSPFYLNTGVVFAPREIFERLYGPYIDALDFVRSEIDSYFFEQIALTLALERAAIAVNALPLRFNYPNQPEFDQNHPMELADVRLLHFLRTPIINREDDFANYNSLIRLLARNDLTGSNEVLRNRLREFSFSEADLPGVAKPL